MNLKLFVSIALMLASTTAFAQFRLLGTADYISGNCIQLTPDIQFSNGLAYHYTKLDLSGYFDIQFDIFLGDKDEGADGITFVIHNDPREFDAFGTWGECMGYGRWHPEAVWSSSIFPSIAIEFDTYQNLQQLDPSSDHVAYLENGVSMHENFWNNDDKAFDIEDNKMHDFRFRWEPEENQITVLLDGNTVYSGKKDLVNEIFEGATQVIWGFTASTGRKSNLQYFCLRNLADASDLIPEKGNSIENMQPMKVMASLNE